MGRVKKRQSTIARLPEQGEGSAAVDLSDKERDAALLALIKKGGRSARPAQDDAKSPKKRISLRIPEDMADRIKRAAEARDIPTASHTWIIEAIVDKLKKERF